MSQSKYELSEYVEQTNTITNTNIMKTTTLTKEQEKKAQDFINSLETKHTCIGEHLELNDIDLDNPFDSIKYLLGNMLDVHIIYYYKAINFLKEHDPSLQDSLSIANGLELEIGGLTSETLASLLASQQNIMEFYGMKEKINNFFETLSNDIT